MKDQQKIVSLLKRIEQWPTDAWILRWGALLARASAIRNWRFRSGNVISLKNDPQARLALAKQALESGAMKEADHHVTALLQAEPSHGKAGSCAAFWPCSSMPTETREQAFEQAAETGGRTSPEGHARPGRAVAAMGDNRPEAACLDLTWQVFAPITLMMKNACTDAEARNATSVGCLATRLSSFVVRNPGNIADLFRGSTVESRTSSGCAAGI